MKDRTVQPNIQNIDKINFPKPATFHLKNGIPVYLFEGGDEPVVKIDFLWDAGNYHSPVHLVPILTNAMLREGAEGLTSQQLSEIFDFYGSTIRLSCGRDHASIGITFLIKYAEKLIPVLEKMVKAPTFPSEELTIELNKRKQSFLIERRKVRYAAQVKLMELLFGKSHPYGNSPEETDFEKVESAHLKTFFEEKYHSKNCKIFMAGNITSQLLNLIDKHFGYEKWGEGNIKGKHEFMIKNKKNEPYNERWDDAVQSSVRIGRLMVNRLHPDYSKLQFINTLLGGYFGSRLMKNIREEKGYTYGIFSSLNSFRYGGYFMIGSEIGKEYCLMALKEIKKEIARLYEEKTEEDEMMLVKNYMMGTLMRSFDGLFSTSDTYQTIIPYGLDSDYFNTFAESLKTISSIEVQKIANIYFNQPDWVEVMIGNW